MLNICLELVCDENRLFSPRQKLKVSTKETPIIIIIIIMYLCCVGGYRIYLCLELKSDRWHILLHRNGMQHGVHFFKMFQNFRRLFKNRR